MRFGVTRVLAVSLALLGLAGCASFDPATLFNPAGSGAQADGAAADAQANAAAPDGQGPAGADALAAIPSTTGAGPTPAGPETARTDPTDDLELAKRHFRESNFGLAEKYFRQAVEKGPGSKHHDTEAWLGLAASYDRLKRFDLADRAYAHAIKLAGATPEILNNQGYSYMLRGDFDRARAKLMAALRRSPGNPYVQNNLALLEKSEKSRLR
jgi:Tfp pilus assembly protein PilF